MPGYLFAVSVDFIYNLFGNAGICIVVWDLYQLQSGLQSAPIRKHSALIVRITQNETANNVFLSLFADKSNLYSVSNVVFFCPPNIPTKPQSL